MFSSFFLFCLLLSGITYDICTKEKGRLTSRHYSLLLPPLHIHDMINNIQTTLLLTKNDETQKTVDERIFEIVIFALKIGEKKQ
jgi:hypothetical protein